MLDTASIACTLNVTPSSIAVWPTLTVVWGAFGSSVVVPDPSAEVGVSMDGAWSNAASSSGIAVVVVCSRAIGFDVAAF
jgi:hypothetical protein